MRTGSDYLRSLNDGRQVFVDGERVKDVTAHLAFREAARSIERLKDARKRSLPMRNRRVDALQPFGVRIAQTPVTPYKLVELIANGVKS